MIDKKYILIILILNISILTFGQNTNDILLNEPLSFNPIQYWKHMNNVHSWLQPGISFDVVIFPQFYTGGFTYKMRVGYFPFYLDCAMIRNSFTFSEITYSNFKETPIHRDGYDISLILNQPVHFTRYSEIFVPYLSIGYQWSSIKLMEKGIIFDYTSQLNLSSWVWKTGFNIFIDNFPFNLNLEYEGTMGTNKKFQVLSLGILIDVSRTKINTHNFNYLLGN